MNHDNGNGAPPIAPNAYRLLWAGFFAIFAAGVGFAVRGGILGIWAAEYNFTFAELGTITGGGLTGFGVVILLGSLIVEKVGYGRLMAGAFLLHLLSALLTLCADPIYRSFSDPDTGKTAVYWTLFVALFLYSMGNGVCEVVVNPVVATCFPTRKTHYLNILHAGWPGGLLAGGVISYFMNGGGIGDWVPLGRVPWLVQMLMFLIPVLFYGFLVLGQRFPKSEAGAAGVSFVGMLIALISPIFITLLVIHAMVGYVELGTDSWLPSITGRILKNPNIGMLLFIYASTVMFTLRFFAGPIEHKLKPLGLLCLSGVIGATGLTLLANVNTFTEDFTTLVVLLFLAMTVYSVGKTFLWPTMLAVVSERFPAGGAIAMGAVGGVGMLSAGLLGGPGIGFKQDYFAAQKLQEKNEATYKRYAVERPDTFLIFQAKGLEQGKVKVLDLQGEIDNLRERIGKTSSADRKDLEASLKLAEREQGFLLKDEMAKWWKTEGEPNKITDAGPIDKANIAGGTAALQLTAAVPATMAVLYLLLILWFRMQGGYKKEVVLTTSAPASEF
jgi:MFS family permease